MLGDMAQYKVTSDLLSGHKNGDIVTDADLAGANIAALVEGGHLAPSRTEKVEKPSTPKDDK